MAGAAAADGLSSDDAARAFRRLFECSHVGLALANLDDHIFAVNPMLSELLGFSEVAVRGRVISDFTHPAETARARELLGKVTAGALDHYSTERRLIRADGSVVSALVDVTLVRDESDSPQFVAVMVIPRDAAFGALRDEMRGVAHDLNNLLTAIVGHVELLLRTEDAEHAAVILESGQRAAALVRRMLVPETISTEPGAVDINQAIIGLQGVAAQLVGAGIDIVLSLDPTSPSLVANREDLERALGNLVANARDAMPHGGRVTIVTRVVDDMVEIAVTDTGVGIPKELQAKIFERDFSTKAPGVGYGIGLANVCAFVQKSGGTISVDSEPDHGATFTLSLPKSP